MKYDYVAQVNLLFAILLFQPLELQLYGSHLKYKIIFKSILNYNKFYQIIHSCLKYYTYYYMQTICILANNTNTIPQIYTGYQINKILFNLL